MPTDRDYQNASDALESPDAPEPVKAAARRILSARLSQSEPQKKDEDQGFSKLAKDEPGAFDVPAINQPHPGDTPELRRARRFAATPLAPEHVKTQDEIQAEMATGDVARPAPSPINEQLASASRRKDLYQPPSFRPEPTEEEKAADAAPISIMRPLDAARAISQKIQKANSHLPTGIGGNTDYFYEPGMDVFKKAMAPLFGEHWKEIEKKGESSPEYKEFSDAVWKTVYEKSKAEGKPVVRTKYAEGWAPEAARIAGGAASLAHGVDRGLTGGLLGAGLGHLTYEVGSGPGTDVLDEPGLPSISNTEAVANSSPIAHDIGMARGFISPGAIGNLAAGGVSKLASGAAAKLGIGAAKGLPARLAVGGARGATQAAAGSAATDVVGNALGQEDFSAGQIFGRAGTAALVGGPVGTVGAAGKAVSDAVRKSAPIGEALGNETSMLHGVKPGKEAIAIRERAAAAGVGPKEMLASEMEAPIAAHVREAHEGMVASHGQKNAQALAEFGHETTPYGELLDTVTEAHSKLSGREGALPFVKDDSLLRQQIKRMADVELVPAGEAGAIPLDEAMKKGFDVQGALSKLRQEGVPIPAEDVASHFDVKVTPKEVGPEELDTIISVVDNANKKSPLHNYEKFQAAARGVRDTFSPGWGQVKSEIGKASHGMEKDLDAIGVGKDIGEHGLNFKQSQALQSLLAGGGQPGRTLATEGPLRRVAEGAGVGYQYQKILAMRELEQAERAAKPSIPFIHFGSGGRGGVGETVRGLPLAYRMDPLLRKYGPTLGAAGAAAPSIDQISRMLAGQENQP